MQLLHADIMQNRVIGTLHKRRINRRHRLHACRRHACCRSHGMLLGNAYVKEAVRMRLRKNIQASAVRHCCRKAHNLLVAVRKLRNRLAKHLSIAYRCSRIGNLLACSNLEGTGAMKLVRTLFGRLIALALLRQHMYHNRSVNLLRCLQYFNQAVNIMTINRSEIGKAQLLKNRGRHHKVLHAALQTTDSLQHICAELHVFQPALNIIFNLIIGLASTQVIQIIAHCADVFGNRHLVVVQHNDHLLMQCACIIQRLERHAACHRAVTDNRYDIIVLALQVTRCRHAERCRNRRTRMAGAKRVMLAFTALWKAGKTAILPERWELLSASGDNLMNICLMANVKN